jgi:hypothetical protein
VRTSCAQCAPHTTTPSVPWSTLQQAASQRRHQQLLGQQRLRLDKLLPVLQLMVVLVAAPGGLRPPRAGGHLHPRHLICLVVVAAVRQERVAVRQGRWTSCAATRSSSCCGVRCRQTQTSWGRCCRYVWMRVRPQGDALTDTHTHTHTHTHTRARAAFAAQELRKQNPALMQTISAHQAEFMRMVMEAPEEGEEDDLGALLRGMRGAGGAGGEGGTVVRVLCAQSGTCVFTQSDMFVCTSTAAASICAHVPALCTAAALRDTDNTPAPHTHRSSCQRRTMLPYSDCRGWDLSVMPALRPTWRATATRRWLLISCWRVALVRMSSVPASARLS